MPILMVRNLALSLAVAALVAMLVGAVLWIINPEKVLFPASFVAFCLIGATIVQPSRRLVNVLRDAHWSYLAVAAFLVLISMWNVKSLTENSYIVPMSIAFTYLLLAIGNAIGRTISRR